MLLAAVKANTRAAICHVFGHGTIATRSVTHALAFREAVVARGARLADFSNFLTTTA